MRVGVRGGAVGVCDVAVGTGGLEGGAVAGGGVEGCAGGGTGVAAAGAGGIAFKAESCAGVCRASLLLGYCVLSSRKSRMAVVCSRGSRNSANASADNLPALQSASSAWVLAGYNFTSSS